ncbi:MAG: cytosolic protein [Candidatus Thorarchaeota archaeon]|nr:MAG: cytosolic protein [Candidatus Thorarchaeota archaeon]
MAERVCNVEKNSKQCSCTYEGCPRQGFCCDCLRYHWKSHELPGCLFPPDAEKTYDRSLDNFLRVWSNRAPKTR